MEIQTSRNRSERRANGLARVGLVSAKDVVNEMSVVNSDNTALSMQVYVLGTVARSTMRQYAATNRRFAVTRYGGRNQRRNRTSPHCGEPVPIFRVPSFSQYFDCDFKLPPDSKNCTV